MHHDDVIHAPQAVRGSIGSRAAATAPARVCAGVHEAGARASAGGGGTKRRGLVRSEVDALYGALSRRVAERVGVGLPHLQYHLASVSS